MYDKSILSAIPGRGDAFARTSTGKELEASPQEIQPPYVMEVEANCEECGGSGIDHGGVDPWDLEPCPLCQGAERR